MIVQYFEYLNGERTLIKVITSLDSHPLRHDKVITGGWVYDVISVEHNLNKLSVKTIVLNKLCKEKE